MFDVQKYADERGWTIEKPLGGRENRLWLVKDADGKFAVLRRYDGFFPLAERLMDVSCGSLAKILSVEAVGGDTVSLEEFIDGSLLSEILKRTLLTSAQACAILREVCAALKAVHRLGFIHRDVKSENILLTDEGRVVLLDLDAAAQILGNPDTNTRLLGTAGYAAPEQFGFARCDVRADIFALGVLLNVMLTGEHPSVQLASGRFGRIVRRCTNTNVSQRFSSVEALIKKLPPEKAPQLCGLCGKKSPGGGCIWCGGAAKRARGWKVRACCAALAGCLLGGAAEFALGQNFLKDRTPDMAQPLRTVSLQTAEPVEVTAYEGDSIPFMTPFLYDLDGDGQDEQYFFAVAYFWPHQAEIRAAQRGSRGYTPDDQIMEHYMPVICRQKADGDGVEAVPELAGLLSNAELSVSYLGERPEELYEVFRMPDLQQGVWAGAIEVRSTVACAGEWVISGKAELAGQPVEAALQCGVYALENAEN